MEAIKRRGEMQRRKVEMEGRSQLRRGMEARKRRGRMQRREVVEMEGRRQVRRGMEATKRRTGIQRRKMVEVEGRMEMAKRTTIQTKRTQKKIIMVEVERKEERTTETQGLIIGIIMAWESQHTISFGVLIFHWSKFCK